MKLANSICLILITFSSLSQTNIPEDYFRSPLDIPMQLSGNFGEMRPNHFHAGFDFKTQQTEGLNVYAVADGYISRIKISTYGYGKAIYITHPNGYTSVYGHLQRGVGFIQDKIVQMQYAEKSYEIEVFFKSGELQVKKGDVIAISGNTGGSEGPHLHFEFRENQTEHIVNPLLFGFDLKDSKKPMVSSLMVYPIDFSSVVNKSKQALALNLSLQPDGTYIAEKVAATGKIGFGIATFDYDDVSFNRNGTYKTKLIENGKTIFGYEFDKMSFDEGRYINAFIDYERYRRSRLRIQKLFQINPFPLMNIKQNFGGGIINILPNYHETNQIEVSDFNGNKTIITIPVMYEESKIEIPSQEKPSKYFIKYKNEANFEIENYSIYFPANTFYEDFNINVYTKNGSIFLHDDTVPVHSNFTISVDNPLITTDQSKYFIASVNGNRLGYNATKLQGTTFSCRTRSFGEYKLVKDSTNPTIRISKSIEGKWISSQKTIVFYIGDDLSGVDTYNGYINGEWVLLEYESKLKRLTHVFDSKYLQEGSNNLKVVVTDNVGNSTIFETQFNRSQK
ncbi:MAG: hypothetical protein ACJAQ1_000976 [Flavobacterium sp.]|jgi:hypothetical protein